MNDLLDLEKLPSTVRNAIVQGHTGPIRRALHVSSSRTGVTLNLYGTHQNVFLRATPLRSPDLPLYKRERWATLNLPLDAPAPRLLWNTTADRWLLLAFELINDHAASAFLAPDSDDVPFVLDAVQRLGKTLTPCPDGARQVTELVAGLWAMGQRMLDKPPTRLRGRDLFETALQGFAPEALQGDTLLHGNLAPWHLRIKDHLVYAVDWSQACQGAPWVDLALLAPHFVEAGHSPEQADALLSGVFPWAEAPPAQVAGLAALWTLACLYQAEYGHPMRRPEQTRLADAGRKWLVYRLTRL
ncbi:hypothetical protein [Nonomuraea sp. B19D2]|uniref:hypothetical protein n=1 Tax=Nonomuraea sp. B19D2 TaxID=3159561 RepID=UPI0032D9ED9B